MYDFCIIGGGIAGAAAAWQLTELGSVVLLEREDALGYHASGRSAALYEANYGTPEVVALNHAGREDHEAQEVLSPRGLMVIAKAQEAETFAHDVDTMRLAQITMDEARAHCPILSPDITMAAYHAEAWDIDTDRLLQQFSRGAERVTGVEVTALAPTAGGWDVTHAKGSVSARIVVNAAGAWADQIAQMAGLEPIGFTPKRRSMARIAAPGGRDVSHWPMFFGPGESWYAKPDAGGLIVSPADADPTTPHDAFADDMVLAEGLDRYQQYVTEEVTRPIASWAGLRTFSPDGNLLIGPSEVDSFWWCAGQGGYGFQSSPGYGRLLGDLMAGRTPAIGTAVAAALDPKRFR